MSTGIAPDIPTQLRTLTVAFAKAWTAPPPTAPPQIFFLTAFHSLRGYGDRPCMQCAPHTFKVKRQVCAGWAPGGSASLKEMRAMVSAAAAVSL